MARVTYRANLSPKIFPFLSRDQGRSVIVPAQDQNYARYISVEASVERDIGIPQIYYGHNFVPVDSGVASVGYSTLVQAAAGYVFVNAWSVQADGVAYKIAASTVGQFFVVKGSEQNWTLFTAIPAAAGKKISVATVQGVSYVQVEGGNCYKFTSTGLVIQTLTGLTDGGSPVYPKGICGFTGYILAWTDDNFYWSSSITPTDFVPSLSTGAGGGKVEAARGKIVHCAPFAAGIYIYTDSNVVAAVYSNNIRYPFTFKEVAAVGGIASSDYVVKESATFKPIAYTSSGLQRISATVGAEPIFPQATDFLSASKLEDMVEGKLYSFDVHSVLKKSLANVADRYFVISYGVNGLQYALLYDASLERWGKLKVPHVAVLEWDIIAPEFRETPKSSMAMLQSDGTVLMANPQAVGDSVVLLGKYQYVRQRMIELQEVVAENISSDTSVQVLASIYGKEMEARNCALIHRDGESALYGTDGCVGTNVSILVSGKFSLTSLVLSFNIHGVA